MSYLLWPYFLSQHIAHGLMFTISLISTALVLWESEPVCFALALPYWVFSSIEMTSEYLLLITQQRTHTSTCPEALRKSGNPAVGLSQRVQCLPDCFTNEEWPHSGYHSVTHKWVWHDGSCLFCLNGRKGRFGSLFLLLLCHIPTAVFNTMLSETTDKLPMIWLTWKDGHLVYCKWN